MENVKKYNSIKKRERKILGNFSFLPPIVPENGAPSAAAVQSSSSTVAFSEQLPKRRQQILQTQRSHRKRIQDYMTALEQEVLRLRAQEARLNQTAVDWKQCALTLIGPRQQPSFSNDSQNLHFSPGVFLWTVSERLADHGTTLSLGQVIWQFRQLQSPTPSFDMALSQSVESYSQLEHELLRNFCENIIPTLDVTEAHSNGYARHFIPLALHSPMVLNSLLAASASHIQAMQPDGTTINGLKYRSIALGELRESSTQLRTDVNMPLYALAAILGLLIDDMICNHKEFPGLLKLADFWIGMEIPRGSQATDTTTRRFLLDQIQMMKALVHPLYQFNQSFNVSRSSLVLRDQPTSGLKQLDLYGIFSAIESAMVLGCKIHSFSLPDTPSDSLAGDNATCQDLDDLLDGLHSIMSSIPPFALGENSLVWVCFVAASKSTRTDHSAFFTSRLAELLQRIGHGDIKGFLAATNIS